MTQAAAPAILSTEGMRAADAAAIASGIASTTLMEAAGRGVAEAVADRFGPCPVLVLCGPGNNGGDGFVAARHLRQLGWRDVRVALLGEDSALRGDAAWARSGWSGPVLPWPAAPDPDVGLVIDAVFGTGLARAVPGPVRALLEAAAYLPRVCVDVPSGMTGDGSLFHAPWLADLPPAALTVTFHARKPAHVLAAPAALCGAVVVQPIGIPPQLVPADWLEANTPDLWRHLYPWPGVRSHKHVRGRLAVFCGPRHATGAARLAARAGARIGAGWTALLATPQAADIVAAHETSLVIEVLRGAGLPEGFADRYGAGVFGPAAGLDGAAAARLAALLETPVPLVLDADALTLLARDEALRARLTARAAATILTPHDGEFARLVADRQPREVRACHLASTRAAARELGCIVVRKGATTVIAAPDGRTRINSHASPWLATAGTGDVLAGLIGGLLAQGLDAFEAASMAVWLHGDAGLRAGPGLLAEDLERQIPAVLAGLGGLHTTAVQPGAS